MDENMRLQYLAWRRRKIRRLIITALLVVVTAVGTIRLLQALDNWNPLADINRPNLAAYYNQSANHDDDFDVQIDIDNSIIRTQSVDNNVNYSDEYQVNPGLEIEPEPDLNVEVNSKPEPRPRALPSEPDSSDCSGFAELCSTTIANNDALSYLALVNRNWRLNSDFSPHDLRNVNVTSFNGNHRLRESAAIAAENLFASASEAGYVLVATSGYRSYWTQHSTHNHWIAVMGETEARRVSARPGHSEHQLGLALDITTHALGGLSNAFSVTAEGTWVRYNAHHFGFIIRYPYGRETCTGYIYEPWHLRFVGIDAATIIFNGGLILEEYLGRW